MTIDYSKIVTNALSALVATVFVGAAVIVWNAATSIDERIEKANENIKEQQDSMKATQDTLVPKIVDIDSRVHSNDSQLKSIIKILAETELAGRKVTLEPDKPFILEEFRDDRTIEEWRKKESEKISDEIDTRQMRIQERR